MDNFVKIDQRCRHVFGRSKVWIIVNANKYYRLSRTKVFIRIRENPSKCVYIVLPAAFPDSRDPVNRFKDSLIEEFPVVRIIWSRGLRSHYYWFRNKFWNNIIILKIYKVSNKTVGIYNYINVITAYLIIVGSRNMSPKKQCRRASSFSMTLH